MLNDKMRAEIDQTKAAVIELLPSLRKGLFDAMVEQGFTQQQALQLLGDYIATTQAPPL